MSTKSQNLSENQMLAADPNINAWVQANAGTGKTSVLVQRLLRILFRSSPPSEGCPVGAGRVSGILCLTYTNAGASEMRNRILAAIMDWAMAADDDLREILREVADNQNPSDEDLMRARQIFYTYIDNPDILKIKTIHGFCEEILRRFPIEAGIAPAWNLVSDANQKRLLKDTFHELINSNASRQVADAFTRIVGRISEYSFDDLLDVLTVQYKQFFEAGNNFNKREQFIDTTRKYLNLDSLIEMEIPVQKLKQILIDAQIEINSSKKPALQLFKIIDSIKQFIDKTINFEEYRKVFLTADDGKRDFVQKRFYLVEELDRVYALRQRELNQEIFDGTVALYDLSSAFAQKYRELKSSRNLLDFDDLILYTQKLFSDPETMGWVLSQLDTSLHHILVDEAQDTSPQQWEIMKALSADFFVDSDTESVPHSLFVVGDTKQSIYGFQGADPDAFATSKDDISAQIKNDLRIIQEIPLAQSFRSTAPILKTVDYFFDRLQGFANNDHKCFRENAAGRVELHALSQFEEKSLIARREYIKIIANKIIELIESGATPSDIMVLVQRRMPFAASLVNELKKREIAVAGSDRIILPEFPAVRDLLNLTRFCLDTTDAYALACVLKSPLFEFDENALYEISHNRGDANLYKRLNEDVRTQLQEILEWSRTLAPYSFFMRVLNTNERREKMIAALGNQIIDPLEEFLTICLSYERTQSGMLKQWLKWFIEGGSEIKRETDAVDGVRIATVHGSKGLEAPIVFLIDTLRTPRDKAERVIAIPNAPDVFLYSPQKNNSELFGVASEAAMQEKMSEYWRLLYVAMTRARDRLYIYGFSSTKNPSADAWHTKLWENLQSMPDAKMDENVIIVS